MDRKCQEIGAVIDRDNDGDRVWAHVMDAHEDELERLISDNQDTLSKLLLGVNRELGVDLVLDVDDDLYCCPL